MLRTVYGENILTMPPRFSNITTQIVREPDSMMKDISKQFPGNLCSCLRDRATVDRRHIRKDSGAGRIAEEFPYFEGDPYIFTTATTSN